MFLHIFPCVVWVCKVVGGHVRGLEEKMIDSIDKREKTAGVLAMQAIKDKKFSRALIQFQIAAALTPDSFRERIYRIHANHPNPS